MGVFTSQPVSSPQQVVVITGCSEGGMGFHFAIEYAKRGFKVYATSRTLQSMKGLLAYPTIVVMELDVTNRDQVEQVVTDIMRREQHIDVLFNNAGAAVNPYSSVVDHDLEKLKATFDVNFYGTLHMCQVVGRHMAIRRKGHIINNGSIASFIGVPFGSGYAASKWAVLGMTHALRGEMKPFGVHVTYLAIGLVKTNILKPSNVPDLTEESLAAMSTPFAPVLAAYVRTIVKSAKAGGQQPDVYARHCVAAMCRPRPPVIYTGGEPVGPVLRFLAWLLPAQHLDWVMRTLAGVKLPKLPPPPIEVPAGCEAATAGHSRSKEE